MKGCCLYYAVRSGMNSARLNIIACCIGLSSLYRRTLRCTDRTELKCTVDRVQTAVLCYTGGTVVLTVICHEYTNVCAIVLTVLYTVI